MKLLPPGPFPPRGGESGGVVDLGSRLLKKVFASDFVALTARASLRTQLAGALESGRLDDAAVRLRAWLDSFPLEGMVDDARQRWVSAPDGAALATLGRAAEVISLATGWTPLAGTVWPLPDARWIATQASGATVVVPRGHADGAAEVAELLGLPLTGDAIGEPAGVAAVSGENLAARRHALGRDLAKGVLSAVAITSPVPMDAASQLALGEVRLEGRLQAAFERFGEAGLTVGPIPSWGQLLLGAPPGVGGAVLRACCQAMILPGTPAGLRRGEVEDTGWLVWPGAVRPVAVHPVAVHVLRALDGRRDLVEVGAALGAPPDLLGDVLDQLVSLGAATAA